MSVQKQVYLSFNLKYTFVETIEFNNTFNKIIYTIENMSNYKIHNSKSLLLFLIL